MKLFNVVVVFVVALGAAYGQGDVVIPLPGGGRATTAKARPAEPIPNSMTPEEFRLKEIAWYLSLSSPLQTGAVQLHGMGDEAAIDVLKILGDKPSLSVGEQHTALDIVHRSFEQPASILNPAHRKPAATLFLLRFLGTTAQDATVKARIQEETKFVQRAASFSTGSASPVQQ